jgi:hypothetical protein
VGCFAKVKLCKWKANLNAPCVLKIVSKSCAAKLKQIDHLISEKELLLTLRHPFIVRGYFYFYFYCYTNQ